MAPSGSTTKTAQASILECTKGSNSLTVLLIPPRAQEGANKRQLFIEASPTTDKANTGIFVRLGSVNVEFDKKHQFLRFFVNSNSGNSPDVSDRVLDFIWKHRNETYTSRLSTAKSSYSGIIGNQKVKLYSETLMLSNNATQLVAQTDRGGTLATVDGIILRIKPMTTVWIGNEELVTYKKYLGFLHTSAGLSGYIPLLEIEKSTLLFTRTEGGLTFPHYLSSEIMAGMESFLSKMKQQVKNILSTAEKNSL